MDALRKIQVVLKFTWSFGAIEGKKIDILGRFSTFGLRMLRMHKTLTGPYGKILIKMDTGMIVNKYCSYHHHHHQDAKRSAVAFRRCDLSPKRAVFCQLQSVGH